MKQYIVKKYGEGLIFEDLKIRKGWGIINGRNQTISRFFSNKIDAQETATRHKARIGRAYQVYNKQRKTIETIGDFTPWR